MTHPSGPAVIARPRALIGKDIAMTTPPADQDERPGYLTQITIGKMTGARWLTPEVTAMTAAAAERGWTTRLRNGRITLSGSVPVCDGDDLGAAERGRDAVSDIVAAAQLGIPYRVVLCDVTPPDWLADLQVRQAAS